MKELTVVTCKGPSTHRDSHVILCTGPGVSAGLWQRRQGIYNNGLITWHFQGGRSRFKCYSSLLLYTRMANKLSSTAHLSGEMFVLSENLGHRQKRSVLLWMSGGLIDTEPGGVDVRGVVSETGSSLMLHRTPPLPPPSRGGFSYRRYRRPPRAPFWGGRKKMRLFAGQFFCVPPSISPTNILTAMPAVNRTENKKNIKAASSVERVLAHLECTSACTVALRGVQGQTSPPLTELCVSCIKREEKEDWSLCR